MPSPVHRFTVDELRVEAYASEQDMGAAAAREAGRVLREAVAARGSARVVIATGNSQFAFIEALRGEDVPWTSVTAFHMDEYVGIGADHPASFRLWIRQRVESALPGTTVHYIEGDAPDPQAECDRYEALLREAPLDLVCMGIGENGHLAFNEPNEADFDDPRWARIITLNPESRRQQVGEGHFPGIDAVPATAISMTIPALLSAGTVQVCAPEARKARAVAATLTDEVSTACPATRLRQTPQARLFLDDESIQALNTSMVLEARDV